MYLHITCLMNVSSTSAVLEKRPATLEGLTTPFFACEVVLDKHGDVLEGRVRLYACYFGSCGQCGRRANPQPIRRMQHEA